MDVTLVSVQHCHDVQINWAVRQLYRQTTFVCMEKIHLQSVCNAHLQSEIGQPRQPSLLCLEELGLCLLVHYSLFLTHTAVEVLLTCKVTHFQLSLQILREGSMRF